MLLISTLLLFSCAAAKQSALDVSLKVEESTRDVIYTEEQKNAITSGLLEVFCREIYGCDLSTLNPLLKEGLLAQINTYILPNLERNNISYEEFEKLNLADFTSADIEGLCRAYLNASQIIGAERAGGLMYDLCLSYLAQAEADSLDKYHNHGYEWFYTEAERYRTERQMLERDVSREDFTLLVGVASLCVSTVRGADIFGADVIDGDAGGLLLTFIRRQAALFDGGITARSAGAMTRVLLEYTFNNTSPSAGASALETNYFYALGECGEDFYRFGQTLPKLIELYADSAKKMTADEASLILGGDANTRIKTLCSILSRSKDALSPFFCELEACSLKTQAELEAIEKSGKEGEYLSYAEKRESVKTADLIRGIAAVADSTDDGTEQSITELYGLLENYLFGIAPYATFVYFGGRA